MLIEVSFQIDEVQLNTAMRRMAELIEGCAEETELEPLYDKLHTSLRFEVEPGCEEES